MQCELSNIYLSTKTSNNNLLNTELVYYTYWTNDYYYNIYERLDNLIIYLVSCEEAYYLAKPLISDTIYDKLLIELKELEDKLNFSYSFSPVRNIGKR